ncbi:MAG TPA: hypothetical protein VJ201_00325 [Candidatus Babeliales bacterium]|nr:hypothetical protein [Candidatus Babeliales bacterium]
MDQRKIFINKESLAPAYLFIGPTDNVIEFTHHELQRLFCSYAQENGCLTCATCMAIRTHQYYDLRWYNPEKKSYVQETIEDVFSTISLALNPGQHLFFVFQDAHMLTAITANSLLKSIEEPPAGYHFIFLTNYPRQILPTITSRCVSHVIMPTSQDHGEHLQLYNFFTTISPQNPNAFLAVIEKLGITEAESVELIDNILLFWLKKYKHERVNMGQVSFGTQRTLDHISWAAEHPPMPGSAKLFWKNLFMQMDGIRQEWKK